MARQSRSEDKKAENKPSVEPSTGIPLFLNLSPIDKISYLFATGAGAGLLPVAPGTFGSIEGVLIFLGVAYIVRSHPDSHLFVGIHALLNMLLFGLGVIASERVCRILHQKDPGRVVIDEVSGQMIALTPLLAAPKALGVVVGFVLFRLFDILKPYPIKKLEHLPGGLGVMADDALAGVFAAFLLWLGMVLGVL